MFIKSSIDYIKYDVETYINAIINLDNITGIYKEDFRTYYYVIKFFLQKDWLCWYYNNKEDRDIDYQKIIDILRDKYGLLQM